jgi:hypothetical protein
LAITLPDALEYIVPKHALLTESHARVEQVRT